MYQIEEGLTSVFEEITSYTKVAAAINDLDTTTIEVAEDCTAFRVGDAFYLANGAASGAKFTL